MKELDEARSLHMSYNVIGAPPRGDTVATEGSGDLLRPGSFQGTFQIDDAGLPLSVALIVLNGSAYLKLPFSPYQKVNLDHYGFTDPVALFDPTSGLPAVFRKTKALSYGGAVEDEGRPVWSITGYLPDPSVAAAMQIAGSPTTVRVTYDIDPHTGHLVGVSMRGPFYKGRQVATITITLSQYDRHLAITPPA